MQDNTMILCEIIGWLKSQREQSENVRYYNYINSLMLVATGHHTEADIVVLNRLCEMLEGCLRFSRSKDESLTLKNYIHVLTMAEINFQLQTI